MSRRILGRLFPCSRGGRRAPRATGSGRVDGGAGAFSAAGQWPPEPRALRAGQDGGGPGIPSEADLAVQKVGLASCGKPLRTMHEASFL